MFSTNGFPETKLIVSEAAEAVVAPSNGVLSLVDLLLEDVAELFSTEGDVSKKKWKKIHNNFTNFFSREIVCTGFRYPLKYGYYIAS